MKTFSTLMAGALLCATVCAQDVIVRQNGGASTMYYPPVNNEVAINDVIADANDGDTIHLPGALYVIEEDVVVNKRLIFIGTGVHPDSSTTSGRTIISKGGSSESVRFVLGSDNSEFHGITVNGSTEINIGTSGQASTVIAGLRFVRCDLYRLDLGAQTLPSLATNISIDQCVIRQLDFHDVASATVRNSIFPNSGFQQINNGVLGSVVENCVFLNFPPSATNGGTLFRSNVFTRETGNTPYANNEASYFVNNRWVLQPGSSLSWGPNVLSNTGNAAVTAMNQGFVSATDYVNFSYGTDYSVVLSWQTAGYAGTAVGVEGGPLPWKVGLLPFNPHWEVLTTPGSTSNGILSPVQIKASAQTN